MLLTFCDTVLPVTIETRPTMAAVPVAVIPAVSESRAFVSVVGTRLRIVHKYCENNQRTSQLTRLPKKNLNEYARLHFVPNIQTRFTIHVEIFVFVYHNDLGLVGPGMGWHWLDWFRVGVPWFDWNRVRVPWLAWGVSRLTVFRDGVSWLQRLRDGVSGLGLVRVSRLRWVRVSRCSPLRAGVCWCDSLRFGVFWFCIIRFFSLRFGIPWHDGLWVTGLVLSRSLSWELFHQRLVG